MNEEFEEEFEKQNKDILIQEEKHTSVGKELLSWLIYIGVAIVLSILIITFVGQKTIVSGSSMNDTLQDGDVLIVDKISYRFSDPERFDIIVFPYPQDESEHFIKRIIGLPGETVQIKNGNIYINGEILQENYGKETIEYNGIASEPVKLGDDEYFVMGDNRNNSKDSRFEDVGNIKRENITGKAFVRISPKFTKLKHQ